MAFTLSQPLYATGGTYTAQQDRLLLGANAVTPGVRSIPSATTGDLAVTSTGAANASVQIAAGDVWVSAGSGQGMYYAYNDASATLGTIGSNSSGSTRTDLIVAQVTPGTPSIAFAILANQVPPYTPANCTVLARVTVKNGFIGSGGGVMQVFNADGGGVFAYITDMRPKAQLFDYSIPGTSYVSSPTQGNLVFDTSAQKMKVYTSTGWGTIATTTTSGFTNSDMATGYLLTYKSAAALPPTSPVEGQLWYQTDTDRLLSYDGTNWVRLAAGASTGRTGVVLRNATNQAIAANTVTPITWDTEDYDSDAYWSTGATITIPAGLGGTYMATFTQQWAADPSTTWSTNIVVNFASASVYAITAGPSSNANANMNFNSKFQTGVSGMLTLAAGDTVRGYCYQNSLASINTLNKLSLYYLSA